MMMIMSFVLTFFSSPADRDDDQTNRLGSRILQWIRLWPYRLHLIPDTFNMPTSSNSGSGKERRMHIDWSMVM